MFSHKSITIKLPCPVQPAFTILDKMTWERRALVGHGPFREAEILVSYMYMSVD